MACAFASAALLGMVVIISTFDLGVCDWCGWFPPTFALPLLSWPRTGAQFCPLYRLTPFHLGTNCWSLTRRCLCLGRFLWLVADGLTTLGTPFSSVERRLSGWYPFGLLLWAAVVVFPASFCFTICLRFRFEAYTITLMVISLA